MNTTFIIQLSTLISLVLGLIGLGTLIYKSGQHKQSIVSGINELKKDIDVLTELKNENKTKIEKVFEAVNQHMNSDKHVNIPLQEQIQKEFKEQLVRIEKRLEDLTK